MEVGVNLDGLNYMIGFAFLCHMMSIISAGIIITIVLVEN